MDENGATSPLHADRYTVTADTCYKDAWRLMWKYFIDLLLLLVIVIAVMGLGSVAFNVAGGDESFVTSGLSILYGILVGAPFTFGMWYCYLVASRNRQPGFKDLTRPFDNYLNVVIASLLQSVLITIGFFFLIVPGVILMCKLAFVPFLVVERELDPLESIRQSWRMTTGHALQVFLIYIIAIPVIIAGLIALVVGVIPAYMWFSLALAKLYDLVRGELPEEQPAVEAEPIAP